MLPIHTSILQRCCCSFNSTLYFIYYFHEFSCNLKCTSPALDATSRTGDSIHGARAVAIRPSAIVRVTHRWAHPSISCMRNNGYYSIRVNEHEENSGETEARTRLMQNEKYFSKSLNVVWVLYAHIHTFHPFFIALPQVSMQQTFSQLPEASLNIIIPIIFCSNCSGCAFDTLSLLVAHCIRFTKFLHMDVAWRCAMHRVHRIAGPDSLLPLSEWTKERNARISISGTPQC